MTKVCNRYSYWRNWKGVDTVVQTLIGAEVPMIAKEIAALHRRNGLSPCSTEAVRTAIFMARKRGVKIDMVRDRLRQGYAMAVPSC